MTCPTCKALLHEPQSRFLPFCSERCQWLDLSRWLAEDYRVADPQESPPWPEEEKDG